MEIMLQFFAASLFALCLSGLHGEEPQPRTVDAEVSQKLLQTWSVYTAWPPANVPNHFDGTEVFTSDSKFVTRGVFTIVNDKQPLEYEGTWQVKDGFLIETVTKSSRPKAVPAGSVTRDKIIRIDDKELVYQTEGGKTVTRKRQPKA